jgi:GTP-binding protein
MGYSAQKNYFSGNFSLSYSAFNVKQLKFSNLKEIVFFGRSNVGKSSLINSLCNQNNLAKTSKTPGLTSAIHFFINEKRNLMLVDVPGYGYAKANKEDKLGWSELLREYLSQAKSNRIIFILLDSRRGFMAADLDLCRICNELNIKFSIIITKIDKLTSKEKDDVYNSILLTANDFVYFSNKILLSSSSKKIGLTDIIKFVNKTL